jgi:hypothetical protein
MKFENFIETKNIFNPFLYIHHKFVPLWDGVILKWGHPCILSGVIVSNYTIIGCKRKKRAGSSDPQG